MVSGRAARLLVLATLAALAVAALVALVLRSGEDSQPADREAIVRATATASFSPQVHRFGEIVTAEVALLVKKDEIQPETLRISADLAPYDVVGIPRRRVLDAGPAYDVRTSFSLRCLKVGCVPAAGGTREFTFEEAELTFLQPPPPGRRAGDRSLDRRRVEVEWPPLRATSRIGRDDVEDVRWRSGLRDLPAPTWRLSPAWLSAVLLGVAALLVALAAALAWVWLARRDARRATAAEEPVRVSPLGQALAVLERERGNGRPRERVALEALASELRRAGRDDLAERATRLAWTAERAEAADVEQLADAVRTAEEARS